MFYWFIGQVLRYFVKDFTTDTHKTQPHITQQPCRVLKFGRQALRSRGWRKRNKVQPSDPKPILVGSEAPPTANP